MNKRAKYVPSMEDVLKVINGADTETQDNLWSIAFSIGRMSEINRLKWDDIDLSARCFYLYTRKKRRAPDASQNSHFGKALPDPFPPVLGAG